jgi:membrane protease YdiL (CAAX protease family)
MTQLDPRPPHPQPPERAGARLTRTLRGQPSRTRAWLTLALRRRVPRWGSVAERQVMVPRLSTAPEAGAWLVVAAGLLFLLARPTLGGLPSAVSVLAVGYLVLLVAALAVGGNDRGRTAQGPLGWRLPLLLGLVGVAGAAVVAGPVADRRVGAVAAGLALGAAVAEEALFRRVLYDRLLRFGVVVAVVGSAGVFALVHLPAYGLAAMPVDLGAALLLSWQRYASGRWTVPAVTHAVANLLAVT